VSLVTFRRLVPEDASEFKRVRLLATQTDPESLYPSHHELLSQSLDEFAREIAQSESGAAYGAFVDNELVAIASIRGSSLEKIRHRANLGTLYTDVAHRGRGIARQLIQLILDDIQSLGHVDQVSLLVHSRNIPAKALYSRLGFKTIAIQPRSMLVGGQYIDEEYMLLSVSRG
jgi:ribosomal protein S18 acetylase RimI-like enzyme